MALDGAQLMVGAETPAISVEALDALARQYFRVRGVQQRLSRRMEPQVVEELLNLPSLGGADLADPQTMRQWGERLVARLNQQAAVGNRYELQLSEQTNGTAIELSRWLHGNMHTVLLTQEFFASADYRAIADLADKVHDMLGEGAAVWRGERKQEVTSFREVMDWLMAESRRGQSIQRYKGLGEMNPDQLWETTMNPESRRMLRVRIEDAIAADEVFTTLMGDQVEPRRDFIERNALLASNIDV
jgi:DNA gyrase subunit B